MYSHLYQGGWDLIKDITGTSLVVQWLRLHAPNAGGPGSIPGRGTKVPHTTTKPACLNYWARMLQSLWTATREACTLQQTHSTAKIKKKKKTLHLSY